MAVTKDEIIEALKRCQHSAFHRLVHNRRVFSVSAAAPVAVAAAPAAGGAAEEARGRDLLFRGLRRQLMASPGVRALTSLGLKKGGEVVERLLPKAVLRASKKED